MYNDVDAKMGRIIYHENQALIAESHGDYETAKFHTDKAIEIADTVSDEDYNDWIGAQYKEKLV